MKLKVSDQNHFTLIELLVVIAIIAVLASMLLPSLNRAREVSKAISCANNLKQIGVGIEMYANDNGDWLPVNQKPSYPCAWKFETGRYLIGDKIDKINVQSDKSWCTGPYLCPSFRDPTNGDLTKADNYRRGGYGWNYMFAGYEDIPVTTRPRKRRTLMNKPSLTILCGDAESSDLVPYPDPGRWTFLYYPDPGVADLRGTRHQKGINMSWGDGHVAKLPHSATLNYGRVGGVAYYYWLLTK